MSKIRVYIPSQSIKEIIEISENETIHKIKNVLRLKQDDFIGIFDGKGKEYSYDLIEIKKNAIYLKKNRLERKQDCQKRKIILGFPLTREEKIDFILQKATELGVSDFMPFISERSINVKPSASKLERWKKIILEATRQSGRLWMPALNNVIEFSEVCKCHYPIKLAAAIKGADPDNLTPIDAKEILVLIGPEGDFSKKEYDSLAKNNFKFIKLSDNILRVETAAIFAAGLLNCLMLK